VLTELMRRHGVVVAPGAIFSRSGAASSFVRVHPADPWPTRVARFLADAHEVSQA
jgi:DNA-binding transcriptional MocR family regulator